MNNDICISNQTFDIFEPHNNDTDREIEGQSINRLCAFQGICFDIKHKPLKRLFDIAFSSCVLIMGLPLFLIIALALKLSSSGSIFYSHNRVGRGGEMFPCYKFRTMNADTDLEKLIENNDDLKREWENSRKLKKDPRVTKLGHFLRKTSLDELPQFWNVLKGDLSVVGPRPVVIDEIVAHFGDKTEKILSVRPGITGLWQVSGRSEIVYPGRLKFDEQYIDQHSMLLDLKLIAKTIPSMIFCKGAY